MTISPYRHHQHPSGNPGMFADATVEYRSFVQQNGQPIDNQHYLIHEHHSPEENYVEAVDLTGDDLTENDTDGLELSTTSTNSTSCSSSSSSESESEQEAIEELEGHHIMSEQGQEEAEEEQLEGEEQHWKEIVGLLERRLAEEEETQLEQLEEESTEEDENEPGTPINATRTSLNWTDEDDLEDELQNMIQQYQSSVESSSEGESENEAEIPILFPASRHQATSRRQASATRGAFQSPLFYSHRQPTYSHTVDIQNLPTYRSLSPEQQQLTDEVLEEINQLEKEYEELLEANSSLQV